jgi:hypothetical protein
MQAGADRAGWESSGRGCRDPACCARCCRLRLQAPRAGARPPPLRGPNPGSGLRMRSYARGCVIRRRATPHIRAGSGRQTPRSRWRAALAAPKPLPPGCHDAGDAHACIGCGGPAARGGLRGAGAGRARARLKTQLSAVRHRRRRRRRRRCGTRAPAPAASEARQRASRGAARRTRTGPAAAPARSGARAEARHSQDGPRRAGGRGRRGRGRRAAPGKARPLPAPRWLLAAEGRVVLWTNSR